MMESRSRPLRMTARRWATKAARALPPPRDETALALLRDLRALAAGRPVSRPAAAKAKPVKKPNPPRPDPKPVQPQPSRAETPGRWIRLVEQGSSSGERVGHEPSDPVAAVAVRAGWQLVDAHERLSHGGAQKVFGHDIAAWRQRTLEGLGEAGGEAAPHEGLSVTNLMRVHRCLDFVRPEDRVFEIGCGHGQLAGVLLREGGIRSYEAIDLDEENVASTEELLRRVGLWGAHVRLGTGDLYDLEPGRLQSAEASLVVCCEVLEHVPDAERALETIAAALPAGADLLMSVPLHGRLEGVWGHRSVFDVARVQDMLARAGLVAHHVEPLANTWTLVLASREPASPARVREAGRRRPAVQVATPLTAHRDFVDVAPADVRATPTAETEVDGAHHVVCRVTGRSGTVRFPVSGLEALRLGLDFTDFHHVDKVVVAVRTRSGRKVAGWSWTPTPEQVERASRTVALRPGESTPSFTAGFSWRLLEPGEVELAFSVAEGHRAEFRLRAAYLP